MAIVAPETDLKSFGTFEKQAPGARFSKVPRTFRARKAIRKTTTYLFCKADLLICCKGNKNKNNCKVSCLETPSFWRYIENYVTRNTSEKLRDFRETGPRPSRKNLMLIAKWSRQWPCFAFSSQRRLPFKIELLRLAKCFVNFHIGHVVVRNGRRFFWHVCLECMVFMWRQRIEDFLLQGRVLFRTSNLNIPWWLLF